MSGWTTTVDEVITVGGVRAEVAICRTRDGKVVAAIDSEGNLGITGNIITGPVVLIQTSDGDQGGAV